MTLLCDLPKSIDITKQLERKRVYLFRLAYSWCKDRSLADDLVQDSMTKALRHAAQIRNSSSMDGWLFRILANCFYDHVRREDKFDNIDHYQLTNIETPESFQEQKDLRGVIREAVSQLPQGQQQVLTLVDLEGNSYNEAADILGIPVGTVMSRLCRARKALAVQLFEYKSHLHDQTPDVPPIRRII